VRDLESHAEQGGSTLTVGVQIIQYGQDDQDSKERIQHNKEKIIDLCSFESRFIKPLEVKDHDVCDQKQRKNIYVLLDNGNSLGGIDRNDVEIEPEEIGIEKGERYPENIAQHKQSDQTASLPLNHNWLSCSAHFCRK
jgi:hypothetical protein